jgi:hypothetical protein
LLNKFKYHLNIHRIEIIYLHKIIRFFVISALVCPSLIAQRNISQQAQNAIQLFNSKHYLEANTSFRVLAEKYPKDCLYQFYLGASIVETNSPLAEAIELLKQCGIKTNQPGTNYYLGLAYYHLYRFKDATDVLQEMKINNSYSQIKDYDITDFITRINRAKEFFKQYLEIKVMQSQVIDTDSINNFIWNGNTFTIKKISIDDFTVNVILLAGENIVPGKTYYFSVKAKGRNDLDIFRSRYKVDHSWSEPEQLTGINSVKNETFPYFDYTRQILYFSSNRDESVGGYDIFKSNADTLHNNLKKPVLLPFPINSPFDEFLFLTSDSSAHLYSNRETKSDKLKVYFLSLDKEPQMHDISDTDKILSISNLNISKQRTTKYQEKKKDYTSSENHISIESGDYMEVVKLALTAQLRIDSVMSVIQKMKDLLVNIEDKDARNKMFAAIRKQENIANQMQNNADKYYDQLIITDTTSKPDNNNAGNNNKIYSDFQLNSKSPYSSDKPFNLDLKLPEGINYRIQLGIFSKPVSYDFFGGLQPITAESIQGGKLIKYYVGVFNRFIEADSSLLKVKILGFKEAFITSYLNNQKIPVERAKDLEINY